MERAERHSDGHTDTSKSQLTGSSFTGSGNDCHRSSNRPRGQPQRQGRRNRPAPRDRRGPRSPAPPVQPSPSDPGRFRGLPGSLLGLPLGPGLPLSSGLEDRTANLGRPLLCALVILRDWARACLALCHSSRQELDWSTHDDICPQAGTSWVTSLPPSLPLSLSLSSPSPSLAPSLSLSASGDVDCSSRLRARSEA